jgi:carbamate kinase
MEAIVSLITPDRRIVVTYGNGPIVGNILLRQQLAEKIVPAMPLDICGAESQGNTGYLLERSLTQTLLRRRIDRSVAALLSLVEVDLSDPAFSRPTKPVGPYLSEAEVPQLAGSIPVGRDADRGFRRLVASPEPKRILESSSVHALLESGAVVITLGGGGVPVAFDGRHDLVEVEAVIDKDLSSSLLARDIGAQSLVILTDIDRVYLDFLCRKRRAVGRMSAAEAETHLRAGEFLPGSMAPKIRAAIDFLRGGGREVCVGLPEELAGILQGAAGTRIVP